MSGNGASQRPLTTLIRWIQDGRALRAVFLAMLGLAVGTVGYDFQQMVANAPGTLPGLQRLEPAPFERPRPGDQTRPYLPRTTPIGPSRGKPVLPGYFGPQDGSEISADMSFHIGSEGRVSAVGTITAGTAERFDAFLEEAGESLSALYLHSPGGSVSDALAMALAIRRAGLDTIVPAHGYCASSCPLLLSGGQKREAGNRSWVGVHQIYAPPPASGSLQRGMSDAQTVSALCQQLLVEMGVDPALWILAMQTPPAQLYVLRPDEIVHLKLANTPRLIAIPKERPVLPQG